MGWWVGNTWGFLAGKLETDSKLLFPDNVCSAEGPDPCELAQNPRYRKGPHVCFDNNENVRHNHMCLCAENIAGNSSISEISQLVSVIFCLVIISILRRFKALLAAFSSILIHAWFIHSVYFFNSSIYNLYLCVFLNIYFMNFARIITNLFLFILLYVIFSLIICHSCFVILHPNGCCSCLVGWALVPNQQRFYTEPQTALVVSGAEFRVSVLTQLTHSSTTMIFTIPGPLQCSLRAYQARQWHVDSHSWFDVMLI